MKGACGACGGEEVKAEVEAGVLEQMLHCPHVQTPGLKESTSDDKLPLLSRSATGTHPRCDQC